ncbi:MAG: hypothetical protein WCI03_14470 [bacterium]
MTELETLTLKLMAFTIVWDTAVAKGIVIRPENNVIDHLCSYVIDSYKEKARKIIAEYDQKASE